jgi:alcohol dehydrogenase class IV
MVAKEKISEAALNDTCTTTNPIKPTAKDIEFLIEKLF